MTAIGETLRRERLRRRLELQNVSRELKISTRLLEAIEAEEFDKLPGGVFTRSFVRQYARFLGLDEEEISAELQRQTAPSDSAAPEAQGVSARAEDPEIRVPPMRSWAAGGRRFDWAASLPALAGVVGVMLLCSVLYAWWQRERRTTAVSPAPTQATQTARRAAAPAAGPPETAMREPAAGVQPANVAAPEPDSPQQADRSAPAAKPSPEAPPSTVQAGAASNNAIEINLKAEEPVWVRARAGGKFLFSGTLDTNETRTLDADGEVELLLGNAGGIDIVLNGKSIGPVGSRGEVRTVQLTSGGFKILPPKPPVLDPL